MEIDVNYTYCGGSFAVYTYTESLCCTPETDICQLYLNTKRKRGEKKKGRNFQIGLKREDPTECCFTGNTF